MPQHHKHITVIAEAGVNHNGDLQAALALVDAAAQAGADYVKFQTYVTRELVTADAPTAAYQQASTGQTSQYAMLKRLELPREAHHTLMRRCAELGIRFLSTPFDIPSVEFLHSLGLDFWKIPSGEITNLPYLRKIGSYGEEVVMSTGMATLDEVRAAVEALEAAGTPRSRVTLLHCTTRYPTEPEHVNLRAMLALQSLGCRGVGYSDHTAPQLATVVPVAAAALGACVIEKHFTLSRDQEGPDHAASLEPEELAAMVRAVRAVECALGDGVKRPTPAELPNVAVARKSIVASRPIAAGELLSDVNMTTRRPADGISPMLWDSVAGRRTTRSYREGERLEPPAGTTL